MESVFDFGRCVLSPNNRRHFSEFEVAGDPEYFRGSWMSSVSRRVDSMAF